MQDLQIEHVIVHDQDLRGVIFVYEIEAEAAFLLLGRWVGCETERGLIQSSLTNDIAHIGILGPHVAILGHNFRRRQVALRSHILDVAAFVRRGADLW